MEKSLIEAGEKCNGRSFDYFREMSNRFKANTMDLLCGSKYQRHSERCDEVVGGPITGKDILMKYLVGAFAAKPLSTGPVSIVGTNALPNLLQANANSVQ